MFYFVTSRRASSRRGNALLMSDTAARHFWEVPEHLVTPAWAEKRRLASALRELIAITVTTDAPAAELALAANAVEAVRGRLGAYPTRTFQEGYASCSGLDQLAVFTDRATLVGLCNPVAPPMSLDFDDGVAVATVTFGPVFEGAPGFVHGGIVAAAFDQLFGYLQTRRDSPSLTGTLTVRYRRPTPLQTELRLSARAERSEGRRHYLVAQLHANGELTAEADAVFVGLEAAGFTRLFEAVGRK